MLAELRVVNDQVEDRNMVVFWGLGMASALDSRQISEGRDIGSAISFDRTMDGQELTFRFDGEYFVDDETESTWAFLGNAVSGPLQGQQLEAVVGVNYFWFAWASFKLES